jgi:hypothetical protein
VWRSSFRASSRKQLAYRTLPRLAGRQEAVERKHDRRERERGRRGSAHAHVTGARAHRCRTTSTRAVRRWARCGCQPPTSEDRWGGRAWGDQAWDGSCAGNSDNCTGSRGGGGTGAGIAGAAGVGAGAIGAGEPPELLTTRRNPRPFGSSRAVVVDSRNASGFGMGFSPTGSLSATSISSASRTRSWRGSKRRSARRGDQAGRGGGSAGSLGSSP